ncbi:MAG TPA: T9SS type A sorting domain-containing protein [Bacteroidia bacterium]|nr:T9SS type A sorting domain-containing protein [Bacteroidia bacterium]
MFTDTIDNLLYVGGTFAAAGGDSSVRGIGTWDGIQWHNLGLGIDTFNHLGWPGATLAITRYKNEIYVGGYIQNAGNIACSGIARWNGSQWDNVAGGVQITIGNYGVVQGFTIIDDTLYVHGNFNFVQNSIPVNGIAKWDGNNWHNIDHPLPFYASPISTAVIYNNELYVAGNFEADSGRKDIAKWDGQNWVGISGGTGNGMGWVAKMIVFQGKLYVAGYFSKYADPSAPGYSVVSWDGNQWDELDGGLLDIDVNIYPANLRDMAIHDNELYITGVFTYAGGVNGVPAPYLTKWNGSQWCGFGTYPDNVGASVAFYRDTLYWGGGFIAIDGDTVNYIAKWIGGNYTDTCSVVGINEVTNGEDGIIIYPNPVSESITISINEKQRHPTEIIFYNVLGEKCLVKEMKAQRETVDVSGLRRGVYVVEVRGEKVLWRKKVVKM